MANVPFAEVHIATLHDALQKASRIAPTKGAAYDRAAGFMLDFNEAGYVEVSATDLEVTFVMRIPAVIHEPRVVRLSSQTCAGFVGTLPMEGDRQCRFFWHEESRQVTLQYGKTRTKAKMNQILGESFPIIPWHDITDMTPAQELAAHVERVAWATSDSGLLSGIMVDGKRLVALSDTRAATVECPVDIDAPTVAVLTPIVSLIKGGTDIRIMVREGKIIIALDADTQITSTVMLGVWPNALDRLQSFDFPGSFTISKTRWMEGIARLLVFVRGNDRVPKMVVTLRDGAMDMELRGAISGDDVSDSSALSTHDGPEERFIFNPQVMQEALDAFPGGTVRVRYGTPLQPFSLSDPTGSYECWVMSIHPSAHAS